MEEIKARQPGDGSLTANVFSAILSKLPQAENESLEAYYLLIFSGIKKTHQRAYFIMAQGLLSMNAWHDALAVLREAVIAFPEHWELKVFRRQCMKQYLRLEDRLRIQGKDTETIDRIFKSGQLERVAYPWIVNKDLERSPKSMMELNAEFEAASENAGILRSPLSGASEDNLGVFAKCKIQQGETILFTRSIWTDNKTRVLIWTDYKTRVGDNSCSACCNHIPEMLDIQNFCSEVCKQEAKDTYHDTMGRKDFSWLQKACREVEQTYCNKVPLMLVKILATAVHQNCKPLKVSCVRTLKANYDNVSHSSFTLFDNIVAPIQILETLGVDVFTDLKFDSWALQTLIMRIERNRVSKKTLGNREYSTVDPLFSMFNHNCMPSAAFDSIGGSTETIVKAVRNINKDEEICISYVDIRLPEMVRREMIRRGIGKLCDCLRCRIERQADERQRFRDDLRARERAMWDFRKCEVIF